MEIKTLDELFNLIDVDDETKEVIINMKNELNPDLSLFHFAYKRLTLNNIPVKSSYIENIVKNTLNKGLFNERIALYYFNEKEENKPRILKFSDIKTKAETIFRRELTKSEINRLKDIRFKYNISYPLLDYALDKTKENNILTIAYVEGIIKMLNYNKIHNMNDFILFIAKGKKLKKTKDIF